MGNQNDLFDANLIHSAANAVANGLRGIYGFADPVAMIEHLKNIQRLAYQLQGSLEKQRREAMVQKAAANLQAEFDHPAVKAGLAEIMSDGFGEATPGPAYAPPGGAVSTILGGLGDQKD